MITGVWSLISSSILGLTSPFLAFMVQMECEPTSNHYHMERVHSLTHLLSLAVLPLVQFQVKSTVFTMTATATSMEKQYAAMLVMQYRESPVNSD